MAASLVPSSARSSENHGLNNSSIAVDFPLSCAPSKDRHVICLTARPHDARHGGNEQAAAYGPMISRVIGAEITRSKVCNALHAIPRQAFEMVFDRVKAVILRNRFGHDCSHVYRDIDMLMLEPVSRQRIVAICPLSRRPIVLVFSHGGGFICIVTSANSS